MNTDDPYESMERWLDRLVAERDRLVDEIKTLRQQKIYVLNLDHTIYGMVISANSAEEALSLAQSKLDFTLDPSRYVIKELDPTSSPSVLYEFFGDRW